MIRLLLCCVICVPLAACAAIKPRDHHRVYRVVQANLPMARRVTMATLQTTGAQPVALGDCHDNFAAKTALAMQRIGKPRSI